MWDTLDAGRPASQLDAHSMRVSCLGMSVDGMALCTGSWDQTLMVWA